MEAVGYGTDTCGSKDLRGLVLINAAVPEDVCRNAVKVRFIITGCQPERRITAAAVVGKKVPIKRKKSVLKFFESFAHTRLRVVDGAWV